MRSDILSVLEGNQDLKTYLRLQPVWYRRLTRNPREIRKMETEAVYFYKKSIPDRVAQLTNGVQMASMMLSMFQSMNTGK
ncbi:YlbE-like family protein [Peribacillus kribbensis]|uniref:YlbE-like family protein n=1 Tax=Peribacillus kribbensis TaxID=356658 RepID=UPI000416713E|nr:YlbE-like family protein [Peribacillus kribbensis]